MSEPSLRELEVAGARVAVREWRRDAGRPVVFLHGLGPTADGLDAARLARRTGGHVAAPDLPGFGRSPPLEPASYAGAALGRVVVRVADGLGLGRFALVGDSWGAWVACHAAAEAADRVAALALLDGGYTEPRDWSRRASAPDLATCVELGRERGARDPEAWGAAFRATLAPPPVSATHAALAAAALPVLLLAAGAHEEEAGRRAAERGLRRFRRALPDADVHELAGVGHDVLADDAAGRLLADWLGRYE